MSKPGWLSMRNLPFLEDKSVNNVYYKKLKEFFKVNTLCPSCEGLGHRVNNDEQYVKGSRVCTVRFHGIPELEELNDQEDVVMSEVIRDILERKLWGRKPCIKCNGSRFVKRTKIKLKQAS